MRGGPRVLVTGGTGFIGSHVVRALADAGYEPVSFSRSDRPASPAAPHVRGDLRDADSVRRAAAGCHAVIHVAALYSYTRALTDEMVSVNVVGTRAVLDAAAREGVRRVVVTSSAATCGPVPGREADENDWAPEWELAVPYKRTKLAAERLALERALSGHDVVVVNPTTTVGPGDRRPTPTGRMVRDVVKRRIRGFVSAGGLNVVSVDDVARGHVLALQRGRSGERYVLGGDNLPLKEVFRHIARHAGVPPPRIPVPHRMALAVAWTAERLRGAGLPAPELLELDEVRLARVPMYFSSGKAERELGYSHMPASAGLASAAEWFGARATPRRAWLPVPSPLRLPVARR